MSFITSVKAFLSGVKSMISGTDLKKVVGDNSALSSDMVNHIELWRNMYDGKAPWISAKLDIVSLGLEGTIAREFADVCLNEMESTTGNENLDKIYDYAIRDLNENLQEGIALGAFCIKPLGTAGQVEYVSQDDFIPISYDSRGRLTDVIFVETRRKGDYDVYRRLERHTVTDKGLTITNKAYKSNSKDQLGNETGLDVFEDWVKLPPEIFYPDWTKPDFGYFKNPIKNRVDKSFNGVSIYESAIDLIKDADTQYGRLKWEYDSAERAIIADIDAVPQKNDLGYATRPKERLLRTLGTGATGDKEIPYEEFSPELRDGGFISGLDEILRRIEKNVGLAYGDLSKVVETVKTATEIYAAKQTKYNRVIAIEDNLKDCLSDLVDALAFYNTMATSGYLFECTFSDSILTDTEANKTSDRADVAMGALGLYEYRMRQYGEDEATAKSRVPQGADVLPDSFGGKPAPALAPAEVQGKSLNEAQTQSLIAIMGQLSSGALTEGQAVNLISTAIGVTKEEAKGILNGDM